MTFAQQLPDLSWDLLLGPYGTLVLLLAILVALIKDKPWLVPGHTYRDMQLERDRYREINELLIKLQPKALGATQSAVELAKKTVGDS